MMIEHDASEDGQPVENNELYEINDPNEDPERLKRRANWAFPLEAGLEVLSYFTDPSVALSQGELSRQTGLSRSTTHKCLVILSALGLLVETAERRYYLTPRPHAIHVLHLGLR